MGNRRGGVWVGLALITHLVGCDRSVSDHLDRTFVSVRDSAGIQLVESERPAWPAGEGWTIAAVPSVAAGDPGGDERGLLFGIVGVVRLADRRIAVADDGSHQVKLFDERGSFLHPFGREGEGPGEFDSVSGLLLHPGDTLGVYDETLVRVQLFLPDGTLLRSITLPRPEASSRSDLFAAPDGGYVLRQGRSLPGGIQTEIYRRIWSLSRLDPEGQVVSTRGPFDGTTMFRTDDAAGTLFLGARGQAAVWGDQVTVGDAREFEVREFAWDGTLERRIRWTDEHVSVTPEFRDAAVEAFIIGMGVPEEDRGPLRPMFADNPFPARLPTYQAILRGPGGELWVAEHSGPVIAQHELSVTWQVFEAEGAWLGAIQAPPGLDVRLIGADFVLGIHEDELGVETVRLHDLIR